MARDNRYVIRAELPGLDPEKDIEVTVEDRALTIHAERRQEDSGSYRSEFRYGSLTRLVRLPARADAKDVTARYDRGVLEVSVPLHEAKPEDKRVPIENADPAQAGTQVTAITSRPDAHP
jgi:HSP20 family protein